MTNEERKAYKELEDSFEEPDVERELSEKDYWENAVNKFESELERIEDAERFLRR